jgi:DNA-binding phage protein
VIRGWVNSAVQRTLDDVFEAAYNPEICNFRKMELAKRAKVSQSAVYKLRNGTTRDPRLSTVLKLCKAVGMDMGIAQEQLGLSLSARKAKKRLRVFAG